MGEMRGPHTAPLIASDAQVETLESYEDRIHHYIDQSFTYIPMPRDNKYYNTEEGWVREMTQTQYISPETHLLEVLEKLRQVPFLLVDRDHNKFVIVQEAKQEPVLIHSVTEESGRIQPEDIYGHVDFSSYEFSRDDVEIYTIDECISEGLELSVAQQRVVSDPEDRWQIITIADLNSRRMKDMLYQRFADLAAGLGQRIEEEYPQPDSILKHIKPNAIGRWKKDQIRGLDLHISEHINMIDMLKIIQASDMEFVNSCGFESKGDVQTLSSINKIRNKVMHANRSLVYNRHDIAEVLDAVKEADRIVKNM